MSRRRIPCVAVPCPACRDAGRGLYSVRRQWHDEQDAARGRRVRALMYVSVACGTFAVAPLTAAVLVAYVSPGSVAVPVCAVAAFTLGVSAAVLTARWMWLACK